MRFLVFVAVVFLSSISCLSQKSTQFRDCTGKEQTQSGLNSCASDEAARADSQLNDAYQRLLTKAERVPGATEKVKTAEKTWIKYRDAYIDAMFPADDKQAAYGTMYPMNFDLTRAELTRQQTKELRVLIVLYDQEGQ
jgi:uncharacterized protein YecT (DUF1311 family)